MLAKSRTSENVANSERYRHADTGKLAGAGEGDALKEVACVLRVRVPGQGEQVDPLRLRRGRGRLGVGDVLYRMAKDVSLADERRRGRGMMMHLYLWH